MVKVVNPFNRKKDTLETNANRCDCICYSLGDNHQSGLLGSKMSNNGWCGCACNNSEDNKQANYRQDKVRIEKP